MLLPTEALARATVFEVIRVDPVPPGHDEPHPGKPVAVWSPAEAQPALALIAALPRSAPHRCDQHPGWAIRAYRDALEPPLFEARFCFDCHEARLHGPAVPPELTRQFFRPDGPEGRALLARFRACEPIPAVVPAGRMSSLPQPELALPGGMLLRPWETYDAPSLVAACKDPDIQHWNRPGHRTLAEAEDRIARFRGLWQAEEAAIWAIAPATGGPAVGLIGVADLDLRGGSGEILYWLLPAGRGKRLMVTATDLIGRWAFDELGLQRVRITHSVANPASCAIATKAGFPLEGTMRGALLHADGWHDEHLHARLRTDVVSRP
ncbi:GNAT family N-acetyltransferase [Streptomyces sp. NPDC023588]|uniref:GNAT family N-acetyltransferase n=1 Tax=Streptomyces sp. NPDC023588 TaxID=3154907 RepID=UPI00340408CF